MSVQNIVSLIEAHARELKLLAARTGLPLLSMLLEMAELEANDRVSDLRSDPSLHVERDDSPNKQNDDFDGRT